MIDLGNKRLNQLRNHFQSLSRDEKEAYLKALSPKELLFHLKHPDIFLFDKQVIQGDDWMHYLLRCGRALALDTLIPLARGGFIKMADIQPGEYIFDHQGNVTEVTAVSEVFTNHDCYKLTFSNGAIVTADAEHLWKVNNKTVSTVELFNSIHSFPTPLFIPAFIPTALRPETRVRIINIEKVHSVPTKCITVDNPEHLFLITEHFIATHNSFGKSYAGSAWTAKKIREGAMVVGLCGPTYDDVANVMVKGILKWFLPNEMNDVPYNHQTHQIKFKNGAIIHCYTSEKEIRGPNLEYLWCDEVQGWADGVPEKIKERVEDITRAVRVGPNPQTIYTSTAKPHPFFFDFEDEILNGNKLYRMVEGTMWDNPNLSPVYIEEQKRKYGNTDRGRQELMGHLLRDTKGAFFTHELINSHRESTPSHIQYRKNAPLTNAQLMGYESIPSSPYIGAPQLIRIIIGVDTAGNVVGDEWGIVVVALYSNKKAYVLRDASGQYGPAQALNVIDSLYKDYNASCIVVESNFGGNATWDYLFRTKNPLWNVKMRRVKDSKTTRAEHISSLYHQGKVKHTELFKELEDQMCAFNAHYSKSPDRLDALCLALTEAFWPQASGTTLSISNLPSF